ncbi:hypothetical protein KXD40_002944 [Peronospora effusa]|uniref:LsmAD domain-containing protein n=1 Tax=Peronospora effusa TaxID=542832 RepID=A0A425CCP9_9STRA|nr:hypothetical protein DD237_002185 [Peronospora effusa]UIZ29214.1 hypothetical protein KXD40_002944 [Peronospora effusa]
MQTTTSKPLGQVTAPRKSNNGSYSKSQNKKKKSPKSHGNNKERPVGPRPVAPPPVAGPWGNPTAPVNNAPPPGFASSPLKSSFSDAHVRLLRHRALFAFRFLVGKAVELQLVDSDERYAGILDCVDPDDFSVVLKNAKRLSSKDDAKSFVDGSTVIFKRHQLAQLVTDGTVNYTDGVFASGTSTVSAGFRTDTEISGRKEEHLYGRELEAASSWLDPALDTGALEDSVPNGRRYSKNQGKAGWNQFEANEKLFGVVSTYDENIYTTKLDKSKISTEQSRTAEKLAQEIEQQSAAGNFHLQEERGQNWRGGKHLNDLDEEARYSSVDRRAPDSFGENTYVPPALRKARRQSSADKSQDRTSKALPTIVPADAATPSPPDSVSAPAASPTAIAPKPLSFSEAVTGRSAVAATPEAASKASPESQPEEMKGAASPHIAEASAQINDKSSKTTSTKSKRTTPKKKDAASGQEQRIESKSDHKTHSMSSSSSSSTTTKQLTKGETPMATSKKALNPNAKEFKLSASAAAFTPTFAVPKEQTSSPYCGSSPVHMPYPHPGVGYSLPMQEEWAYDGAMGGEEGGEMGMPLYMQGCYTVPMGPNGVPMMYPPMMMQHNMGVMSGQRGNYGGYQQQGYNPQGYYSPPNGGHPEASLRYIGDPGMPGGVGHQPPLPPTPSGNESLSESPASVALLAEVESIPARSKQMVSALKKK